MCVQSTRLFSACAARPVISIAIFNYAAYPHARVYRIFSSVAAITITLIHSILASRLIDYHILITTYPILHDITCPPATHSMLLVYYQLTLPSQSTPLPNLAVPNHWNDPPGPHPVPVLLNTHLQQQSQPAEPEAISNVIYACSLSNT